MGNFPNSYSQKYPVQNKQEIFRNILLEFAGEKNIIVKIKSQQIIFGEIQKILNKQKFRVLRYLFQSEGSR